MSIRLGDNQRTALAGLFTHARGEWHEQAGWVIGTQSLTDRVLRSLLKYELVEMTHDSWHGSGYGRFTLTTFGETFVPDWVKAIKASLDEQRPREVTHEAEAGD
jgi:hypothetical protein